jgi:hypothetical protein
MTSCHSSVSSSPGVRGLFGTVSEAVLGPPCASLLDGTRKRSLNEASELLAATNKLPSDGGSWSVDIEMEIIAQEIQNTAKIIDSFPSMARAWRILTIVVRRRERCKYLEAVAAYSQTENKIMN